MEELIKQLGAFWGPAGGGVAYNMLAKAKGGGNTAASGITLHSGEPITDCLVGSVTVDLASIAAEKSGTANVTVTGAALGDLVEGFAPNINPGGLSITGHVTAANTVTLWFYNNLGATPVDLASATFTVYVRKRAG